MVATKLIDDDDDEDEDADDDDDDDDDHDGWMDGLMDDERCVMNDERRMSEE